VQYIATLFDKNYLSRGLALRESLSKNNFEAQLFILCLDDFSFHFIQHEEDKNLIPVRLASLEYWCPQLLDVKGERTWAEYIFTLSPLWPLYLLEHYDEIELITTMDADLYFFSSPQAIFDLVKHKSILITPHNFSNRMKFSLPYGRFNVSFQSFRRDAVGLACLQLWKKNCLEWCFDKLEPDRFADQKYLDEWPALFGDFLQVLDLPGTGLAPWNIEPGSVQLKSGILYCSSQKLIFYHFHRLRFVTGRIVTTGLDDYCAQKTPLLLNKVYAPYIKVVRKMQRRIGQMADDPMRLHGFYSKKQARDLLIYGFPQYYISKNYLPTVHLKKWVDPFLRIRNKMIHVIKWPI
jgi:hypothetical protein